MPPRNVALLITDLAVGGAERCLVELATRLDRSQYRPWVYSLDGRPAAGRDALVRRLDEADIAVHFLGARRQWQFPRVVRRLSQQLRRDRIDLLQSFLFHANIVGRLAARLAGVPVAVSGLRVAERQAGWHVALDRWSQRLATRYVCVSRSVAEFAQTRGGLPPEKLAVIPNGIDVSDYPADPAADLARLGVPSGRQVVTFVGRLAPQKGLDWLLETGPAWLNELPACDLLVVGAGPEEERLRRTARQLGIAPRVHFAGWRPEIPQILAASRLLVLPSRWEGMPNVVLEAMASRLPVLATAVEGVTELLGPDADMQTVPYGDTAAWAKRLVELMKNRMLATRLGHENRRRVEQQFTIQAAVTAYEGLWRSLPVSGTDRNA